MRKAGLIMIGAAFGLAACGEPSLRNLQNPGDGPDEFIVVPVLPLQQPEDTTTLPKPTPGGSNRSDQQPSSDAAIALGGQLGSPNAPIPSVESGLVSYAQRNGVDPSIRAKLAEEDAAFRKRQGRFTQIRIIREDIYERAYRRQALNPFTVANSYRRAGIPVPSAPPGN